MVVKVIKNKVDKQYYEFVEGIGWCTSHLPLRFMADTANWADYNYLVEIGKAPAIPEPKEDFFLEELIVETSELNKLREEYHKKQLDVLQEQINKRDSLLNEATELLRKINQDIKELQKLSGV